MLCIEKSLLITLLLHITGSAYHNDRLIDALIDVVPNFRNLPNWKPRFFWKIQIMINFRASDPSRPLFPFSLIVWHMNNPRKHDIMIFSRCIKKIQSNLAIRNGLIRSKLVLRNHFL